MNDKLPEPIHDNVPGELIPWYEMPTIPAPATPGVDWSNIESINPRKIKYIIDMIEKSTIPILDLCREQSISIHNFYTLVYNNTHIQQAFTHARECRAESWDQTIQEIANDDSRDRITVERETKDGRIVMDIRPDNTAVKRAELKINVLRHLQKVNRPDRYGDKLQIDQHNKTTSVNLNISLEDIQSASPETLDKLFT